MLKALGTILKTSIKSVMETNEKHFEIARFEKKNLQFILISLNQYFNKNDVDVKRT